MDTNIILSDILKENTPRIEKLKKDSSFHKVPCYISDSVKAESYEKVQQASIFLGDVVRNTFLDHMLEVRKESGIPPTDPITSPDVKALEDLFSHYYYAIQTTRIGLLSPVSLIEEWSISFLGEKLDQGVAMTISEFLRELIKKLLKLTSSIEDLYDDLVTFERGFVKIKTLTLDSRIISCINDIGIHKPDCDHITSALTHQAGTGEKTVFVTLDFSSILDKRQELVKQLGIECSGPLYALHHLV